MNPLQTELQRLYSAPEGVVRALVLELARPADWGLLSPVWRGLQTDLALPAPAVMVSGVDGYQLWLSLAEPVPWRRRQGFWRHCGGITLLKWRHNASASRPRWQHLRHSPHCRYPASSWPPATGQLLWRPTWPPSLPTNLGWTSPQPRGPGQRAGGAAVHQSRRLFGRAGPSEASRTDEAAV